jgi:hypothetical protein
MKDLNIYQQNCIIASPKIMESAEVTIEKISENQGP